MSTRWLVLPNSPCRVCRSTRYRQDDDGFYICEAGHLNQDYREEEGEFDATGRLRRVANQKRTRDSSQQVESGLQLSDSEALFCKIEAFQELLKLQVKALINSAHVHPSLADIVRELWLLFIGHTGILKTAEIPSTKPNTSSQANASAASQPSQPSQQTQEITNMPAPVVQPSNDLMDESSHNDDQQASDKSKAWWFSKLKSNLSLVFCYLGCVWLCEPILPHDLSRLAANGEIPFIGAFRYLPKKMQKQLRQEDRDLFLPAFIPNGNALHRLASAISKFLTGISPDLKFPPINIPLLLDRFVRELSLSEAFVACTLRLVRLEPNPERFVISTSSTDYACHVSIIAWLVIAIKLVYVTQKQTQHGEVVQPFRPPSRGRPSYFCAFLASLPSWEEWQKQLQKNISSIGRSDSNHSKAFATIPWTYSQAQTLDENQLKAYLAFCEENIFVEPDPSNPRQFKGKPNQKVETTSQADMEEPPNIVSLDPLQGSAYLTPEYMPSYHYVSYALHGWLAGLPDRVHKGSGVAGSLPHQNHLNLSNLTPPTPLQQSELDPISAQLLSLAVWSSQILPATLFAAIVVRENHIHHLITHPATTTALRHPGAVREHQSQDI